MKYQIKRSTGSSPPGSLLKGELAWVDGLSTLYVGDAASGTVTPVAGGAVLSVVDIQNETKTYVASETGTANSYIIAPSPAVTSLVDGLRLQFITTRTNTGNSQLTVSGLTTTQILGSTGIGLVGGEIIAGTPVEVIFRNSKFYLNNTANFASPQNLQKQSFTYRSLETGSGNTYAIALDVAPTSLVGGHRFQFTAQHTNTGAATLNVNSLGANAIVTESGAALTGGEIVLNGIVDVVFDGGSNFYLINSARTAVGQGGTGATTSSGARTNLGAAASGANSDITSLSGITTALSVLQGGTGSTTSGGARTSLGAAASGSNSDITSLSGLTTPLTVGQGGTGTASLSGVLKGNGGSAISSATAGTDYMSPGNVQNQTASFISSDTGSANAYAVATSPAVTSLVAGLSVTFIPANTNTGASTLAVSGLTATAIKKNGTVALAAGEILAGRVTTCVYDGTNFQLVTSTTVRRRDLFTSGTVLNLTKPVIDLNTEIILRGGVHEDPVNYTVNSASQITLNTAISSENCYVHYTAAS